MAFYLDANVLIAMVEGEALNERQIEAVQALADGSIMAATCELSLAECLVKPYREHNAPAVAAYLELLCNRPEIAILPVSRAVLMRAARVRAETRLKLPDAIHLAAAMEAGCEAFVTDDRDFGPGIGMRIQSWDGFEVVPRP